MDVHPHNPPSATNDLEHSSSAVIKPSALIDDLPMAGWGGPRLPLMSPLSELIGLSSLFDTAGFMESLLGDLRSFEVPNVTLSDAECLITVDLRDLDVNNTSFKVYGSKANGISVEISTVKESRSSLEDEAETENETESDQKSPEQPLFRLRGASSFSAFTTVRSFPTPQGCEIMSDKSKATINAETNQLLIKLPKTSEAEGAKEESNGEAAKVVHASQALREVPQEDGEAILRSALEVEKPASRSSWLSRIFGLSPEKVESMMSNQKVQVPIVKYDEF